MWLGLSWPSNSQGCYEHSTSLCRLPDWFPSWGAFHCPLQHPPSHGFRKSGHLGREVKVHPSHCEASSENWAKASFAPSKSPSLLRESRVILPRHPWGSLGPSSVLNSDERLIFPLKNGTFFSPSAFYNCCTSALLASSLKKIQYPWWKKKKEKKDALSILSTNILVFALLVSRGVLL